MTTFRRRSIAARLTWMNVLVSGAALLLAFVSFFTYNLISFRGAAVNNLASEAQIVGANSVSAIVFNDQATAETTLSALSNSNDVVAAAIYTQPGTPFVQYMRDGNQLLQMQPMPANQAQAHWVDGADILIGSRIVFQGKEIGVVYIHAYLHGLREQALRYAIIAGIILLFCLGVGLLVGNVFRKLLAAPIVSLSDTARLVSRYRDYSLRFAPTQSYDELRSLTDAFNEMLAEIQQRDAALEQARDKLELRVEERTAQLQTANRELEAFSYTVAHDLRGPLDIINGINYILQESEKGALSVRGRELMEQLTKSVTEMANLIDDLLNLSRATSGTGLQLVQLDLSLLADSVLKGLTEAHPERKVEYIIHGKCYARADQGLMQVVMQNLLRNAWKFTSRAKDARIEIGCTESDHETVYYVRDNGAGFDQDLADRLFQPFQRLHAERDFTGTGVGLATVQRIVARHGGRIWAEGEIGKGAIFYFTLGASTN
jgi:signal transduction histidine kinase